MDFRAGRGAGQKSTHSWRRSIFVMMMLHASCGDPSSQKTEKFLFTLSHDDAPHPHHNHLHHLFQNCPSVHIPQLSRKYFLSHFKSAPFQKRVAFDVFKSFANLSLVSFRRSLRSRIQVCPKALAKFWRSDGWRKSIFALTSEKLRSTAFQRCISWGGGRLVEMGQNSDFLQKSA